MNTAIRSREGLPGADGLVQTSANFAPLNPVSLLEYTVRTYPDNTAIVHKHARISYREFFQRCRALAAALHSLGVRAGDTVAILAPNTPAMLEAHFGVLMVGAVLNAINTRLDAPAVAFNLNHGNARLLLADTEYGALVTATLALLDKPIPVIDIQDEAHYQRVGQFDYETLLATANPHFVTQVPSDEWHSISLLYTSGTTGDPKGVVYHARGAYLNALSNALGSELNSRCRGRSETGSNVTR